MTPSVRRVSLAGTPSAVAAAGPTVNVLVPRVGDPAPRWPMVAKAGRIVWPQGSHGVSLRSYTARRQDADAGLVEIDFVLHGDGPAAAWAAAAGPGALLGVAGAGSPTRGTRTFTVGPAAATADGVPARVTLRTEGVTSETVATVSTSTGRGPSERGPAGKASPASAVVTSRQPRRRARGRVRRVGRGHGPTRPPPGEWGRPGRRSWTEEDLTLGSQSVAWTRVNAISRPSTCTLRDQTPVATARSDEVRVPNG